MPPRLHLQPALKVPHLYRDGCLSSQTRYFSATPSRSGRITLQRKRMLAWFKGPGQAFRLPLRGSTNYVNAYDKEGNIVRASDEEAQGEESGEGQSRRGRGARNRSQRRESQKDQKNQRENLPPERLEDLQPFPLNPYFRSPSVLSERLKQEIYKSVVEHGHTIRRVSQERGIAMERVAAVVRLERMKQDWLKEGKPLAIDFSRRMLDMLPQTQYNIQTGRNQPHESINDLPVHQSTLPQIFHPAPESKEFTRRDAARVFHRGLAPAEDRIPHPDMIESARDLQAQLPQGERGRRKFGRWEQEEQQIQEREEQAKKRKEEHEVVIEGKRWDFKFSRVHSDKAVGWRYGVPLEDRKKGHVKMPQAKTFKMQSNFLVAVLLAFLTFAIPACAEAHMDPWQSKYFWLVYTATGPVGMKRDPVATMAPGRMEVPGFAEALAERDIDASKTTLQTSIRNLPHVATRITVPAKATPVSEQVSYTAVTLAIPISDIKGWKVEATVSPAAATLPAMPAVTGINNDIPVEVMPQIGQLIKSKGPEYYQSMAELAKQNRVGSLRGEGETS
ncbi:MAG: hypothetical protein Q9159_001931 [Coniocarpon cinnabarinum]